MSQNATCLFCGEVKNKRYMVKHRNENIQEKFGFCKECVLKEVESFDTLNVVNMLRLLNIPFVESVWENALEKEPDNAFGKYLQLIATQKRYKDFANSDYGVGTSQNMADDFKVTDSVIAKWGMRDSKEEYVELETLYQQLTRIKEPSTTFEERRYVQNVKLGKVMDDALEQGDSNAVAKLRTAYVQDLENLGLNVEKTDEEGAKTLGIRIAEWERRAPIPTTEDFTDVEKVETYLNKWFLIPMKRVFGRASEEEINELYK